METVRTSYIITGSEAILLLRSVKDVLPNAPAEYLLTRCLAGSFPKDAAATLVDKKLARRVAEVVVVEPVVHFLAKSVVTADKLWILSCEDCRKPVFIIRGTNLWLLITPYTLAPEAWRVMPLLDIDDLRRQLATLPVVTAIDVISRDGVQSSVAYNRRCTWLEDDC